MEIRVKNHFKEEQRRRGKKRNGKEMNEKN